MNHQNKTNHRLQTVIALAFLLLGLISPQFAPAAQETSVPSDASASPGDTTERTISKSFTVTPGGKIDVDLDEGNIELRTADQDQASIVVERKVKGGSDAEAARLLSSHQVTFVQEGNEIRVLARTPKSLRHSWFGFGRQPNLNIHCLITLPKQFNAILKTSAGDNHSAGLRGVLEVRTSGGDLSVRDIQGPVEAHTSGGNVKAMACSDNLHLQTSGGDIEIEKFTGASVHAGTSGGNIHVTGCVGKLQVETSGGDIKIKDFAGPSIQADTSGGSISAELTSQPKADCVLHTSGGDITVTLPANLVLNLDAHTSGGTVSTELPVTIVGKKKEDALQGSINGGGPTLLLKTSGGSIQLVKR